MTDFLTRKEVMAALDIGPAELWRRVRGGEIVPGTPMAAAGRSSPRLFWRRSYIDSLRANAETT
jgi:hypothetical protein